MVITSNVYGDFKTGVSNLPPSVAVFWSVDGSGAFIAIAVIVSGNAALRFSDTSKPSTWAVDFPLSIEVQPGFDVNG